MPITKIISGGQTGADQAALHAAKNLGLETGGWVPKGWRTEAGPALWLKDFGLVEHESWRFQPRTYANVRDSDVTVWFGNITSPGYFCTHNACRHYGRELLVNPTHESWHTQTARASTVNIAGNRERTNPGIGEFVEGFLKDVLRKE